MPDDIHPIQRKMKQDWNDRATENARRYITSPEEAPEVQFRRSGERDVKYFFEDLWAEMSPASTVLDVGCGMGRMDEFIAPRVGHIIGIDVAGEMVARARERLAALRNVEFVEGDGVSLAPIGSESIDLVFSHVVFQHVPREVAHAYFVEVWRVLRPGGHFAFQIPEASESTPADPPPDNTWDLRFHSESDLRRRLCEAGFTWHPPKRFRIETPELKFDYLRVHVSKPRSTIG